MRIIKFIEYNDIYILGCIQNILGVVSSFSLVGISFFLWCNQRCYNQLLNFMQYHMPLMLHYYLYWLPIDMKAVLLLIFCCLMWYRVGCLAYLPVYMFLSILVIHVLGYHMQTSWIKIILSTTNLHCYCRRLLDWYCLL